MYYGAGNYEAFAHPLTPKDADKKSAYIIGSGLAGLSAAFYLVRDAKVKGENIHILEKLPRSGGSCDGERMSDGFYMRGGREMDNHFEVMWDMYRDIPSAEDPNVSVLDYYYWLNKRDPNYSLCRATDNRGENAHTGDKFTLDEQAQKELMKLFFLADEKLEGKAIEDFFDEHFWQSNFWLYWQTMFAFQRSSSALEMKRYLQRYCHHIDGLPDFSALRFTKYNQYESMILPLENYLRSHGVQFDFGYEVTNVLFAKEGKEKWAKEIVYKDEHGEEQHLALSKDDLVFITNGCCTDTTCYGNQDVAPDLSRVVNGRGDSWDLWNNIAKQDPAFGNPSNFANHIDKSNWMSATIEVWDEDILSYVKKICQRDPLEGKVTTGGIVTCKDSRDGWFISWTINRQPQFQRQPNGHVLVWMYGLTTDKPGNYIKKPMRECTGEEICEEWLYFLGVPTEKIHELASKHAHTTTAYMPYINAFFMPRHVKDRPLVVPEGAKNFAFIGQFAETPRDTIFTTEYSIRTGMEAVYTLLDVDRAVPEVWGSVYDVRELLRATYYLSDKKSLKEMKLPWYAKPLLKKALKKIDGTDIKKLLVESKLL